MSEEPDATERLAVEVEPVYQCPGLTILTGSLTGRVFRLDRPHLVVGRAEDADIRIQDQGISRQHARLIVKDGRVQLEDLNSTNGTFVGKERVSSRTLTFGDQIQFGTVLLRFGFVDDLAESMRDLTAMLGSTLRFGEILELLLERLERSLPVGLGRAVSPELEVLAERGDASLASPLPAALLEEVITHRQPISIEDLTRDQRFPPPRGRSRAWLAVPVVSSGEVAVVIVLEHPDAGVYGQSLADLALTFAGPAGVALANAQAHQELAQAYSRLQDSEAQLVQSAREAAVGQLAAGVAHELNSPLGAIVLALDSALAHLESKPERARERLNDALRSAERSRQIVTKLLFYSREGTRVPQPFDLNRVVEDTLAILANQLELDRVQLECDFGPVPTVEGKQGEIQQVILNLLLNARDAVKAPGARAARIRVSTRSEEAMAVLEVADWGPGLDDHLLDKIFEPFFTTKPVGKGTGLGLSVSQQIVQQHNGTLSVTPGGQGACFTLRLPAG